MSFRLVPISVTLNDLNVVVKQLLGLPWFQKLLLIVYDHISTICAII